MSEQGIPIALGLAGVGAVLVASGVTGNTLSEVFSGNFTRKVDTSASASASGGSGDGQVTATDPNASIAAMKATANKLSGAYPYRWGGGHSKLGEPTGGGFDCSGAVSAVLGAAGLLSAPLDSTGLMSWGMPGSGKRVTVWANPVHTFMTIDGKFFGTGALGVSGGPRWGNTHPTIGFVARHPGGL